MYTLEIKNEKEYAVLLAALETNQDIADDTVTEPLWIDNKSLDPNVATISTEQLQQMRLDINERIDRLVVSTTLTERVRNLKS